MVATIVTVLGVVVAALLLVVGVNLMTLALMRAGLLPRSDAVEGLIVVSVAGGVGAWLWAGLDGAFRTGLPALPQDFKVSAVLLYLAGCLIYLEIKSLVSRSCSLRILVDLLDAGGQVSVEKLKSNYGGGLGLRGLLTKRVCTMVDLGLLRLEGEQVGPLSRFGRAIALMSLRLRQLLRLELVG